MKRRIPFVFLPAIILFAALSACNDDNNSDFYNGSGSLQISLQLPDDAPSEADFSLTIEPVNGTPGTAHTWPSFAEFEQRRRYVSGTYAATVTSGSIDSEGFDCAWYEGHTDINIAEGSTTRAEIQVELCNAFLEITVSDNYRRRFPTATATAHVPGGHFVTFATDEVRPAALRPGNAVLSVTPLADTDLLLAEDIRLQKGQTTTVLLDFDPQSQQIQLYDTNGGLLVQLPADNASLSAPAPTVTRFGPEEMSLPEFVDAPEAMGFVVDGAKSVTLNICSQILSVKGAPAEINLSNPDAAGRDFMAQAGIQFDGSRLTLTNITRMLDYLSGVSPLTELTLTAVAANGRMSAPQTISITTLPVGVRIAAVHSAVIGTGEVMIEVDSDVDLIRDNSELSLFMVSDTGKKTRLAIQKIVAGNAKGRYLLTIQLPQGNEDVDMEIVFNGKTVGNFTIHKVSPDFTVVADAFACSAVLKVCCDDPVLRKYIINNVAVTVGTVGATVLDRDADNGTITITGLPSGQHLDVTLRMQPDSQGVVCHIVTEYARALPNGDFEDAKESVNTGKIPSGGRYSQTIVPIFNQQNTAAYKCAAPEKWANTNAKTCGKGWKNLNTWYMCPSVISSTVNPASGDRSVVLQSTAFDPDGEVIPDFLQTSEPYTPYSQNIPNIRYRAAGRLFLGTYRFDALTVTEQYQPGISFDARPSSLNGYFKYLPSDADPTDKGLVEVRVLDANGQVLAQGRLLLSAANSWTAFAVPLRYGLFGVKAARIEVTISSSSDIGSIAYETSAVKTLNDARTATSVGSILHIDNLSLAY